MFPHPRQLIPLSLLSSFQFPFSPPLILNSVPPPLFHSIPSIPITTTEHDMGITRGFDTGDGGFSF